MSGYLRYMRDVRRAPYLHERAEEPSAPEDLDPHELRSESVAWIWKQLFHPVRASFVEEPIAREP